MKVVKIPQVDTFIVFLSRESSHDTFCGASQAKIEFHLNNFATFKLKLNVGIASHLQG